ncbi:4-oxalocrotonate tautomerase family protein [Gilvimarinus sp. SDUM040013]|uniref:Tautomerase n=1 Tax=Gilvimarinus gilvus TaxID=3058038 RepID=A0ABU4S394_9GAMM|nr:4-oxalocrotonate tautomerase family protein [Gilvimarinus sp. SDUM040013]MDO3384796.1 4-oxalocrotonate tautomerase family protein [Gilvimarinus sp. SDUM040013]MDX6850871.1 4-oxalocrotonate tautomerase family protein [Gilvimarinus sp. SDUM040013]
MPIVEIKITDENVTAVQKNRLVSGATQLMVDVLGKDPATTFVLISEISTVDWGIGGVSVAELRRGASTSLDI